ncbi:MAG: dipeptidase [Bacteroidota bacterium]|nr:dipeptidase [Bacteroidota bacterium]
MKKALDYAAVKASRFVDELIELLTLPSVSTDPAYADKVEKTAAWLVDHLGALGATSARLTATQGHPIVTAHFQAGDALPTVLVYGHYDVQPPDPLELWESPPFEPVIKGSQLYARGSCDDKGQLFMHLKALEAWMRTTGRPPVNVKLILEGEEECGSASLPGFIEEHKEWLDADVVIISDTSMFAPGVPSITYGLRGMTYVEVSLTGPDRDLHSGTYGGAIENPINALARMIGNMHDADHRITIDGFYDEVVALTSAERQEMAALPFDVAAWLKEVGVSVSRTERGYSELEAATARPTLDCNGIWGGYIGEGAKTVLPSRASAKISMRLVPNQNPKDIAAKLQAWMEAKTPPTMRLDFRMIHGAEGVLVDTDSTAMAAAAKAVEGVYGCRPFLVRIGGSIPVVADFKRILGLDSVLMGFGLDSDAIHSPNEHFGLDRFAEGIEAIIRFHALYADMAGSDGH